MQHKLNMQMLEFLFKMLQAKRKLTLRELDAQVDELLISGELPATPQIAANAFAESMHLGAPSAVIGPQLVNGAIEPPTLDMKPAAPESPVKREKRPYTRRIIKQLPPVAAPTYKMFKTTKIANREQEFVQPL